MSFCSFIYLNLNKFNILCQFTLRLSDLSSQFNCLTIEDLENIPYEFFTSSSIAKIFEGIDFKIIKLNIKDTTIKWNFSYTNDVNIMLSFFDFLKTTKILDSLEEIEINGLISYDLCPLSKIIAKYK